MSLLALVAPLVPKLLPVAAKGVVRLVEKIKGNGNGPTEKKPMADGLMGELLRLAEKAVPGLGLPAGTEVGAIVQSAWATLNNAGVLKGKDTALDEAEDAAAPVASMIHKETLLLCATIMEAEAGRMRKLAQ